jgi:3'-phosphoadenosine 5'-phosphosulfate (PAPS) 3'-phosphatase
VAKDEPVLGHHAVVSAADFRSQKAILGVLGHAMPGVPVVCEARRELVSVPPRLPRKAGLG